MGLVSILEAGQICVGISYGWTIYDMEIRDNELISPTPPNPIAREPRQENGNMGKVSSIIRKVCAKVMQRMS